MAAWTRDPTGQKQVSKEVAAGPNEAALKGGTSSAIARGLLRECNENFSYLVGPLVTMPSSVGLYFLAPGSSFDRRRASGFSAFAQLGGILL